VRRRLALPFLGALAYLLFGEVNIGRWRVARLRTVLEQMPPLAAPAPGSETNLQAPVSPRWAPAFRVGQSISGFAPIGGNAGRLLADSNATIDAMVADIDRAETHVHLLVYIWLPDRNGLKVVEALKRAAARGVQCRAVADDLGSRAMIRSIHWTSLREAGVRVARALPIGNPVLRALAGRIDLRNHRKIVVIDGRVTYCGSQNCADPEFRIKAKYAPWVDAVVRFEGPIARQNQHLFVADWMAYTGEDVTELLREPLSASRRGFAAQVIGTGPTSRYSAMPEMFESLCYAARPDRPDRLRQHGPQELRPQLREQHPILR
jgi:cardiolipin synthase